jgi:hypothetical protein
MNKPEPTELVVQTLGACRFPFRRSLRKWGTGMKL